MKILLIHNKYEKFSGEEAVVESQIKILKEAGHIVITYFRGSDEIKYMFFGKIRSFFLGVYNQRSIRDINQLIKNEKPDLVHIHNLFPLISPVILPVIKSKGISIVMTVHNYRLMCPNGLFFSNGEICEKCAKFNEFSCMKMNCEKSLFKSIGYALRNYSARKNKFYANNVDVFACLTEFQKNKLIEYGFDNDKVVVIPNMYDKHVKDGAKYSNNGYVAFAGRISPEKGVPVLLNAARLLPNIQFKLAGGMLEGYDKELDTPSNVEFVGMLNKYELPDFYNNSKLLVFSSIWYETFGLTMIESMAFKKPVIASNIAGVSEIVEDGVNGLLFEVGNSEDLAKKIRFLYDNPKLANQYGETGFEKMKRLYSKEAYSQNLLNLYKSVLR